MAHGFIVSTIIAELLGPLTGNPREEIRGISPDSHFITGMIAPPQSNPEVFSQEVTDSVSEEEYDYSEDETTMDTSPLIVVNPVIHPDRLPASIGITFAVENSGNSVRFSVCVTWARYIRTEGNSQHQPENYHSESGESGRIWTRHPFCRIFNVKLTYSHGNNRTEWRQELIEEELRETMENWEGTLELIVKARRRIFSDENSIHTISVYLVARRPVPDAEFNGRPPTQYIVFQPQIRVVLEEGNLVNLRSETGITEFDIPFVEEGLEGKAKGHMCSAIWREIDLQQINRHEAGIPENVTYPFLWVDREIVRERYGEETYRRFLYCDVRTEFIPVVEVPSPDLDPPHIPQISAEDLAEAWNPEDICRLLMPLVDSYRSWIEERRAEVQRISDTRRKQHLERILDRHITALERIRRGIDLLVQDENVRLAFCFANKAVSLQYRWKLLQEGQEIHRIRPFIWRPFQIGFILLVLESICNPESRWRNTCDLLWIPTGGGKTEAYLGLIAFLLAWRRRRYGEHGLGTAVISRYTLRLLGIQQFLRTLRLITACEYLRVYRMNSGLHGWRPSECDINEDWIWGKEWFSCGLWVGGNITPNYLHRRQNLPGAIEILRERDHVRKKQLVAMAGSPSQVSSCPACGSLLAIPEGDEGIPWGYGTVWFPVRIPNRNCIRIITEQLSDFLRMELQELQDIDADFEAVEELIPETDIYGLGISIIAENLRVQDLFRIWESIESFLNTSVAECNITLLSLSPLVPGYFAWGSRDFRIICPSPRCYLRRNINQEGRFIPDYRREFREEDIISTAYDISGRTRNSQVGNFRDIYNLAAHSIHIPALTVDEQIYRELPSVIIATVDKFARLPAEPKTASIFGNVNRFHRKFIFYRRELERHYHYGEIEIEGFVPPELIIQDELHLIEGPLGSLAGLYETGVDFLCSENSANIPPKYIASTATTRGSEDHIGALFARETFIFPPLGIRYGDNFFTHMDTSVPGRLFRNSEERGRIYIGIAPYGWGPLTPQVRLVAAILRAGNSREFPEELRRFYITPVSYYNAVRELSAGLHLFHQDIQNWLETTGTDPADILDRNRIIELSGRIPSGVLPFLMKRLETGIYPDNHPHAVLTTSIFGTGVDIPHLSVMVVNGQPKTTASYIQATGRVGRQKTGIVVCLYRVSRPRDLSHYEFFATYHRALYRYVEEISVYPFSRRSFERGSGGTAVALLRLSRFAGRSFGPDNSACIMVNYGTRGSPVNTHIDRVIQIFINRNGQQPVHLQSDPSEIEAFLRGRDNGFGAWVEIARENMQSRNCGLRYVEYFDTHHDVVLGDLQHEKAGRRCVFKRVPSSLRNVEEEVVWRFTP